MRNLIRSPLTWVVAAEIVVVTTLVVLAWNVVASAGRPVLLSPAINLPDVAADDGVALPDFPVATSPNPPGLGPGLNRSSAFWRARLAELNRDQAVLARLEWRLVHSAMDAIRRYVETTVVPALRRAERVGARP
jgi:hypothetical protein